MRRAWSTLRLLAAVPVVFVLALVSESAAGRVFDWVFPEEDPS